MHRINPLEEQGSRSLRGTNERAAFILLLFVLGGLAFRFAGDRLLPNNPRRDPVRRPYYPKNDPPVGKEVPDAQVWTVDGKKEFLVSVPHGKQWLLILFYPPCTSCHTNPLQELKTAMRGLPRVECRIVVPFDAQGSQSYAARSGLHVPFYEDREHRALEAFNAVWSPRAYLIDASGRRFSRTVPSSLCWVWCVHWQEHPDGSTFVSAQNPLKVQGEGSESHGSPSAF